MLKFCLNKDNQEIKHQEITLPMEELSFSLDSSVISGVFDKKYQIKDEEIVSFITPNVSGYTDIQIETQDVLRTGYFVHQEAFPIQEVTEYLDASSISSLTPTSINLEVWQYSGNTYIKTSNTVEYSCLPYIKVTKRYVTMPNGKNYYETYTNTNNMPEELREYYSVEMPTRKMHIINNGIATFNLELYSFKDGKDTDGNYISLVDEDGCDIASASTLNWAEINSDIIYYVDSDIVTYDGVEYSFGENYTVANDGKTILLPLLDESGETIVTLSNYVEYPNPIPLTKFTLTKPSDLEMEWMSATHASKFYFINYKDKKYDFEFVDGYWEVALPDELCECLTEDNNNKIVVHGRDKKLTYILDKELDEDPYLYVTGKTGVTNYVNRLPILSEYRATVDGEYLIVSTTDNYTFDTTATLICKFNDEDEDYTHEILQDAEGRYYINYCNYRVYLTTDEYKFTIAKYESTYIYDFDSNKYVERDESTDEITEEFEVTMSETEFKKISGGTIGTSGIARYVDANGNVTEWHIEWVEDADSIKRCRAYKRGSIIEYYTEKDEEKSKTEYISGTSVTSKYKFNAYKYCTIANGEYRANYSYWIGEGSEDDYLRLGGYNIIQDSTTHEYPLNVLETHDNYFICQVDDDYISTVIDCEKKMTDNTEYLICDVNSLQARYKSHRVSINDDITKNGDFKLYLKNISFGIDETPSALPIEYDNVLDGDFFHLYKRLNYYSFPIRLGTEIELNLHQEEIVEKDFYEVEKENSVNSIIDMEKDIYVPVIQSGDSFQNVYEIRFNLHLRTRNLETWKIEEKAYKSYSGDMATNVTNDNWSVIDNYSRSELTEGDIFSSDLLYFLNFTEDDVFYQKSRVGKSFLRLLFYDSPNDNDQNLLHTSTIFLNENSLYKRYVNNIDNEIYRIYNNIDEGKNTYCNVNTEPVNKEGIDYTQDRLDCSFSIINRDETDTSSEGFYIYMFKDYGYKLRPNDVYMKVEFNHAGQGKTLQFFMPTISTDNKLTCMVDDSNSKEITELNGDVFTEFEKGLPLNQVLKNQYIKLNVQYDEETHRYIYYVNQNYYQNDCWENHIMTFNLWEIKFKDES